MTLGLKVLILGYGEMGHAMEFLIQAPHQVSIWQRHPPADAPPLNLQTAVAQSDVILFCLPVVAHVDALTMIQPHLKPTTLCASIAKGLHEDGCTAAQLFQNYLPEDQAIALIYGPMISEEIRGNRYAFAQVGTTQKNYETIKQVFAQSKLLLQKSDDIIGISWSVILKNVYALVFGMADELQLGDNMRGYLAVAALRELDEIVIRMGGQRGSPYHLAGLGDLITTATSEDSHHHELGRRLARGESENIRGEGIHTLAMVKQYSLIDLTWFPLFKTIDDIVQQASSAQSTLDRFLQQSMQ
ncbi:MAG: hypothetical protein OEZ58_20465 [Gammaproteobacteria bacterium]|nr:hypothetical protein [Gammaproteobacteria bacterium]